MSDLSAPYIWLDAATAKVKSYSAAGRGKVTVIKIELHVESAWDTGEILRRLQECQNWKPPAPPKPTKVRVKTPGRPEEEMLYLPAPAPRLTYQGE